MSVRPYADQRAEGQKDGHLEIPPCVLQDISPLGPLPKNGTVSCPINDFMNQNDRCKMMDRIQITAYISARSLVKMKGNDKGTHLFSL